MDFINFICGLIGLSFFTSGVGFLIYNRRIYKYGLHVTATVHNIVEKQNSKGKKLFYPVFRFYIDTRLRQVTYDSGFKSPVFTIDQQVDVVYSTDTETLTIKDDKTNTKLTIGFLLTGIVLLILCFTL